MLKEQVLWAVVVLFLVIAMMGIALREVCRYTKCVIYMHAEWKLFLTNAVQFK